MGKNMKMRKKLLKKNKEKKGCRQIYRRHLIHHERTSQTDNNVIHNVMSNFRGRIQNHCEWNHSDKTMNNYTFFAMV